MFYFTEHRTEKGKEKISTMAKSTKRSDGRIVRTITDHRSGKRVYFYGSTEREINRKILDYNRKAELGRTFAEVADAWWSEIYDTLMHQTVRGYQAGYSRALHEFGNTSVKDSQPRDVQSYLKKLAALNFAQKTIANHRIILNQIFNRAIIDGDIQFNPCVSVRLPKGCKKGVRDPASAEDEERILTTDHEWLVPLVALLTGLRKGEILALQWRDVDFENNIINVTKSVEFINQRPHIKDPKTISGKREVPLLQLLKDKLLPLRSKPSHFIFSDDGGKSPIKEYRYTDLYDKYRKEVGISCTAHQLRHSYATIAVEEDVNPKDLQNALGHAEISTTMDIYAKARKKSAAKVAAKLNAKYSR